MPTIESDEVNLGDLTIVGDRNGRISQIRGQELPSGLIYAPIEPDSHNTIPAEAMQAMTAAIHWARLAQERARQTSAEDE